MLLATNATPPRAAISSRNACWCGATFPFAAFTSIAKNRPSLRMPRMSATPGAWLGMYVFRLLTKIPAVLFFQQKIPR